MAEDKNQDQGNDTPSHTPDTSRGEDVKRRDGEEPGRQDKEGTGADRPAGGSSLRDATGVNPKAPVDPKSPKLIPE